MKEKELEARLKFARKQLYQRKKKPLKKHGHETYKEPKMDKDALLRDIQQKARSHCRGVSDE